MEHPEVTPKVSVCVITYNQEEYIRQCLQSIVDQRTDFDFEVIIGDDCSTDGTRAIIQEFKLNYPKLVKCIFQERNTGGTKNYLDVHAAACGKYVAHIDGDDLMLPNKLQRQANYMDAHPGCAIVWHGMIRFTDKDEEFVQKCSYESKKVELYQLGDLLQFGPLGNHSSSMYRKWTRDTYTSDHEMLDWMFYTENLAKGSGALLHEVLGCYRVNVRNSLGSATNANRVKKLMAKHMVESARLYPLCRKDIFIGATVRAIAEIRGDWELLATFLWVAMKNCSLVSPFEILRTRRIGKKLVKIRFHDVIEFNQYQRVAPTSHL